MSAVEGHYLADYYLSIERGRKSEVADEVMVF